MDRCREHFFKYTVMQRHLKWDAQSNEEKALEWSYVWRIENALKNYVEKIMHHRVNDYKMSYKMKNQPRNSR